MGTFLLGSLVGAATVVYMIRGGRMPMLIGNFSQGSRAFEGTTGAMMNMAKDGVQAMKGQMSEGQDKQKNKDLGSMSQVQKFVEQDAEVKKAVNEIMKENNISKQSQQIH